MSYVTEQILQSLREARVRKGVSQRELSARSGVPQSHISKIESGGVDLRMSSLIDLAHSVLLILESCSPFKGMLDQSYSPLNSPVG